MPAKELHHFTKDFPTPTELKILKVLMDEPRGLYGLQIVGKGVSRGSVYVLLTRLQCKGYVEVHSKPDAAALCRPHYVLTAIGKRVVALAELMHMFPERA